MTSLAEALLTEVQRLVEPLAIAGRVDSGAEMLLGLVGQSADAADDPGLAAALTDLSHAASALTALQDDDLDSWSGLEAIADAATKATTALAALEQAASDPGLAHRLEGLGVDLTGQLTGVYLRRFHSRLFRVAAVLTLISPAELHAPQAPVMDGDTVVRRTWFRDELHFDRIDPLLNQPWPTLRAAYLPNDLASAADAHAAAALLFPMIGAVLDAVHLPWSLDRRELNPPPPDDTTSTDPSADDGDADTGGSSDQGDPPDPDPVDLTPFYLGFVPRLTVRIPGLEPDPSTQLGLSVLASSAQHPGGAAGYILAFDGTLQRTVSGAHWTVALSTEGEVPAFVAGPGGLHLAPSDSPVLGATVKLAVDRVAPTAGAPAFVFGATGATRIEVGALHLEGLLDLRATASSAALTVAASAGRLVIAASDGDGFLQAVLPSDGLTVGFDLGLVVSTARGVELKGGAGLAAVLPVQASLGIGRIEAVELGLAVTGGGVIADVACSLSLRLGPVTAVVDALGIRTTATFPGAGGNLGLANADVGFKGPSGIGLEIAAGPVTGGGLLAHDEARGEYYGAVALSFEGIAVKAFGLLTTSGASGFSLLVLVSADFTPVQLGMGFTLNGVGGLVGINRTMSVDALRAAVKTGDLGTVLSPPDPVTNAARLVAIAATLFPAAAGRYVFGPLAKIGWGTPTLITIDLCLVLELPSPIRLVILGHLRAVLPDEREAIVQIKTDLLGVVDFDRREASVDASLVDSHVAGFAITGDMAMRMSWGAEPTFLLAVGGFHPSFAPPPGFPALDRVAIALATGDNPRLRLEAYVALTSNTVQFGARVDLSARAGSFSIAGFLSFDALVTLSPLAFEVDIAAKLAVKAGGHTLLSISLQLTLSGPEPWRAVGRASFSILFFDVSFGFDVTIGDDPPPQQFEPVDVGALVHDALVDVRAWTARPPAGPAVALRAVAAGTDVVAHPLGDLEVRQRVAPLGRTIERFGAKVPSGATSFAITGATVGTGSATVTPVQDLFAPGQFEALSDEQALSRASFEAMTSGAAVGERDVAHGAPAAVEVVYEQVLVTADGIQAPAPSTAGLPDDVLAALLAVGVRRPAAFAMTRTG